MRKGKTKNEEKGYMSVVLVPHSSNHVKVLRFSSFYGKLLSLAVLLVALLASTVMLLLHSMDENRRLKESLATLGSVNTEQRNAISQKSQEVEAYKAKEETFNQKINDFTKLYREILDKYLGGKSANNASRSGDESVRAFSADIGELKDVVENLNEYYGIRTNASPEETANEKKLMQLLDSMPTLWPATGRISDKFGYRTDPFTRKKTYHEGLDIAADYGASIKAAASGKVIHAGTIPGYGKAVKIDHGRGLVTLYGHASKLLVEVGQTVKKGDVIAKVGSSGRSTGPHLHFEVLQSNAPIDPLQYLGSK